MKHTVIFDPKKHSYTVDGVKAVSVTTVLQAVGIADSFDDIPDIVKQKVEEARDRGNYYDELAESAIDFPFELNDWQIKLLDILRENNLTITRTQQRIGTLKPFAIAGSPDFMGINETTKNPIVVDLKATYAIYTQSVTWQTNIYSWINEPAVHDYTEKYVLHYDEKSERFTLIQLEHITEETINNMLESYQLGELFVTGEVVLKDAVDLEKFSKTFEQVQEYKSLLKKEQEKLDKFEESIMNAMKTNALKTVELENYKITYTPEGTKNNPSYQKMAQEFRKMIKDTKEEVLDAVVTKHTGTSIVKPKLTITKKKVEEVSELIFEDEKA